MVYLQIAFETVLTFDEEDVTEIQDLCGITGEHTSANQQNLSKICSAVSRNVGKRLETEECHWNQGVLRRSVKVDTTSSHGEPAGIAMKAQSDDTTSGSIDVWTDAWMDACIMHACIMVVHACQTDKKRHTTFGPSFCLFSPFHRNSTFFPPSPQLSVSRMTNYTDNYWKRQTSVSTTPSVDDFPPAATTSPASAFVLDSGLVRKYDGTYASRVGPNSSISTHSTTSNTPTTSTPTEPHPRGYTTRKGIDRFFHRTDAAYQRLSQRFFRGRLTAFFRPLVCSIVYFIVARLSLLFVVENFASFWPSNGIFVGMSISFACLSLIHVVCSYVSTFLWCPTTIYRTLCLTIHPL